MKMSLLIKTHSFVSVLVILGTYFFGSAHSALSVGAGTLMWFPNIFGMWLIWQLLIIKKNVALAVGVIVLKYPFLFLYVYAATNWFNLSSLSFGLGAACITISALICASIIQLKSMKGSTSSGTL